MKRRTVFRAAAGFLGLGTLGGLGASCASQSRNPYYQGPPSDHFDGTRFFNPGGAPPRGFADIMRWRFGESPAEWPETVALTDTARPATRAEELTVTMVGHATMLLQVQGLNILTDPVWSERASPFSFAGPKRVVAPGLAFEDLPAIDMVLLSHNHYDHLDMDTLKRLKQVHDPLVITPLGNDAIIAPTRLRCVTMDWGESTELGPLGIHCLPSHHWSARGVGDRSMALWAAFMLTGLGGPVLFVGDTGFDDGKPYRDLPQRFGPLRAALLPIGAYDPRWFMADQHQNPDEAVRGFLMTRAAYAIGHHWGTIQLTNEARTAPRTDLLRALARHGVPEARFRALEPGEAWTIPVL